MKVVFKDILLEDALKSIGCIVRDSSGNVYYRLQDYFVIDNGEVILIPKDEVPNWVKIQIHSIEI